LVRLAENFCQAYGSCHRREMVERNRNSLLQEALTFSGALRFVGERQMLKPILGTMAAVAALSLAACGTTPTERGVTGAGIGAGIGLLGGPPGVLIGAAAGGAIGATTTRDDLNLGDAPFSSDGATNDSNVQPASSGMSDTPTTNTEPAPQSDDDDTDATPTPTPKPSNTP
jgi:osmotically inducible lipoprotein OsmB